MVPTRQNPYRRSSPSRSLSPSGNPEPGLQLPRRHHRAVSLIWCTRSAFNFVVCSLENDTRKQLVVNFNYEIPSGTKYYCCGINRVINSRVGYWFCPPVHWDQTVHWCRGCPAWLRGSRDHRPPPGWWGPPPEACFYAIWDHYRCCRTRV